MVMMLVFFIKQLPEITQKQMQVVISETVLIINMEYNQPFTYRLATFVERLPDNINELGYNE